MSRPRKNNPDSFPTLDDVGRAAGVSKTAVAGVLNHAGPPWPVSPKTRERIIDAAAKLQYRPSATARALVKGRMHMLGVVAGSEFNDYFFEVLNGIVTAAARHGQNTMIFTLHGWRSGPARLHDFCDGRVDGIILLAPTFDCSDAVPPEHIPFVSIHATCAIPGIVNIETHEERGAYALVRHLIALGHRRIMHLSGPARVIGAERRIRGYQRALNEAGIPFDPQLQLTVGYTTHLGREAMCAWLRSHTGEPLPQAVFCANDACATGCLEALAEIGLRVPDDVSVAGFDDTLVARVSSPQLTTVRQPLAEMGARAVELLLARVDRCRVASRAVARSIVYPVKLIPRASVGPPPTAKRVVPAQRQPIGDHGENRQVGKSHGLVLLAGGVPF
jgi:LacI family transcriptional regulator